MKSAPGRSNPCREHSDTQCAQRVAGVEATGTGKANAPRQQATAALTAASSRRWTGGDS